MGVISILLGIIAIIAFAGAGAVAGNAYIGFAAKMGNTFTTTTVQAHLSDTTMMILFIAVFGFIGLLIGMCLIMQGLNYNKLVRIQKRVHRL